MEGDWDGAAEQALQHLEDQRRRRVAQEMFASASLLVLFLLELGGHEVELKETVIRAAEVAQASREFVLWPQFGKLLEESAQLIYQGGVTHARMLELFGDLLLLRGQPGDRERAYEVLSKCLALHEKMENPRKIDQLGARLAAESPTSQV